jgi:hypothetical protein
VPYPIASTFASRFRRPVPDPEASDIERPGRALRFWSLLPVALAFALFGAVVWLAYQDTSLAPPIGEPPLIKAAADPYKLPPDETEETTFGAEEGTVGRLWSDADQADQPERLLPTPETPLSPPALEEPATAAAGLEEPATAAAGLEEPATAAAGVEEPATAAAPPRGEPGPDAMAQRSASAPAAEVPAGAAAGETDTRVAAAPAAPENSAQPAVAAPASDESLRQAEAALDRLLAEVTAMSDDTDAPAATPAATPTPAETAAAPPATAEDQASSQPPTPSREQPATAPAPTPEPTSTAAAPAAPTPPAPAARAPAPLPEVRPAGATTAAAPAAAPRRAPTQSAAATVAEAAARRPPIAPGGDFRIQLAAVRGEADARRAWQLFMADLGPVLADVEPIFERAETANGVFYRVQVGPFASQDAAEGLCEQLKQRNASCFVIRR